MLTAQGSSPHARFAQSLTSTQREQVQVAFDSEERLNWHYVPRARRGVAIRNLNPAQKERLDDLLHMGLSQAGFRKAMSVLELEGILGAIEGSSRRDPGRYFVTLFGKPESMRSGWRFEGHHLSVNFASAGGEDSVTPMFLGANPARVSSGRRKGWEPLRDEELIARELVLMLDGTQRRTAMIAEETPGDIVTAADREVRISKFEGLPARKMNAAQRALLQRLIGTYVGNAAASVAGREMSKLEGAGIEAVHFAWAGSVEPGEPHYYRIHGPTVLIEYDNSQNGANHIHTVWRSPGRDFGQDPLRKHYAEADHHRAD